jgi:hypothetical protein
MVSISIEIEARMSMGELFGECLRITQATQVSEKGEGEPKAISGE